MEESANPNVIWADIQAGSKAGQLHFGMTNPTASNSGFVALVGVAEALAPSGAALDAGDGRTARQTLLEQLDLLDSKMDEIADAVHQKDRDRLLANGSFLEQRFGGAGSGLSLPGPSTQR